MHGPPSPRTALAAAITALLAAGTSVALTDGADPDPTIVELSASPAPAVEASASTTAKPTAAIAPAVTAPVTTDPPPVPLSPAAPPPAPSPAIAPPPAARPEAQPPLPTAVPPAPTGTAQERSELALLDAVPVAWRDAVPATVHVIEGSTSYADSTGEILIGRYHAEGSWPHLLSVIAHEFGHLIAIAHGSGDFAGAGPDGWPDPNHGPPAEAWADCVAQAFTGITDPSYGMPPCPPATLDWTRTWLTAGPP